MGAYDVDLVELASTRTAVVRGHAVPAALADFLGGAFGEVMRVLGDQRVAPVGPPFARYVQAGEGFEVEAGFPVDVVVAPSGRVLASALPSGLAAQVLHRGPYEAVGAAYDAAATWLEARGYVAGEAFESYLDGPGVAEPRTLVTVPCRRSPAPAAS